MINTHVIDEARLGIMLNELRLRRSNHRGGLEK
jgi:hypothetical protein